MEPNRSASAQSNRTDVPGGGEPGWGMRRAEKKYRRGLRAFGNFVKSVVACSKNKGRWVKILTEQSLLHARHEHIA